MIFIFLALTLIIIPWHSGYIYSGSDVRFHINRIIEITHSLNKGFPLVNFITFNKIGYDVNSFYPSPLLCILSPVFLMKSPVNAYYILLLVLLFLTQFCTYFAGRALKMQQENAILFAIFYTFSEYMLFILLYAFELGEALAFIVLPLILVSIISYMQPRYVSEKFNKNQDIIFLLSFVWVTYSHLLSAMFCLLIAIPLLLLDVFRGRKWGLLKKYVIIGFNFALTTSFFWINLLHEYLFQGIVGPQKYLSIPSAQHLITNSLENKLTTGNIDPVQSVGVGIILLISAFVLITNYFQLNKLVKTLTVFAVAFFILSSNLFCWDFLDNHVKNVEVIQFTFRFLIVVVLTLSTATCLYHRGSWKMVLAFITCITIFNINASKQFVNLGQRQEMLNTEPTLRHEPMYGNFKVSNGTFKYLYQGFYGMTGGPGDYLTQQQKQHFNSIATHQVLLNGKRIKSKYTSNTNNITYTLSSSKKGTVDLPVLKTNHEYQVMDNGHLVSFGKSKRGTLNINNLCEGRHVINVRVIPSAIFKISIVFSILGLSFIIIKLLKNFRRAKW